MCYMFCTPKGKPLNATQEFELRQATAADDSAIRRLLATTAVPGQIAVTYEREPNYFWGCHIQGDEQQVLVMQHTPSNTLVGIASRAVQPRFVNGKCALVGYLSQLRIAQPFRGRSLLGRGWRAMRALHEHGAAQYLLASITAENTRAMELLVDKPRGDAPAFREIAPLYSAALIVRPAWQPADQVEIRPGSAAQLPAIVRFLQQQGATRQFFPLYTVADFTGGVATRGFQVEDFAVAYCNQAIVGVIGLWDQQGYKQTVVQSYAGRLRWARPVLNVGLQTLGAQPLPQPGQPIRAAYASFIAIANDEPLVFAALLRRVYRVAAKRRYAYLMVGLAEADPLLAVVRRYQHVAYHSRVYALTWGENTVQLDGRLPYMEIATL